MHSYEYAAFFAFSCDPLWSFPTITKILTRGHCVHYCKFPRLFDKDNSNVVYKCLIVDHHHHTFHLNEFYLINIVSAINQDSDQKFPCSVKKIFTRCVNLFLPNYR